MRKQSEHKTRNLFPEPVPLIASKKIINFIRFAPKKTKIESGSTNLVVQQPDTTEKKHQSITGKYTHTVR